MEVTREQVIDFLSTMTAPEMATLTRELEGRWGVVAAPAISSGPSPDQAPPPAEQTEFTVTLTSGGANKIQVIKAIREITGLGLKEAKDMVDGVPKEIRAGVGKTEAEEILSKIIAAGGSAEVR